MIGILLDIDDSQLDTIEADHPKDCNTCLYKMLKKWLKMVKPEPSWITVVEALKAINNPKLAQKVKLEFCT